MKIKVKGDTPIERLTNLTRGILAVPKADIERADKKPPRKKRPSKSR
jgi:hypothetical protein